jgi:hypothetical protein
MKPFVPLAIFAASLVAAHGQILVENYNFTNGATVPDTGVPVSDTRSITSSAIESITSLIVSFQLRNSDPAGAYDGDYYVSLQHSSGFSVLLNRVGRTTGTSATSRFGYGDNGFNVTFSDDATAGDIHVYRDTQYGGNPVDPNYVTPLTGEWAPDGRNVSPLSVTTADARTATLSSFKTLPANGTWTLQVVDVNGGSDAILESWGLTITGAVVPEPAETALFVGAFLMSVAFIKKTLEARKLRRE